MMVLTQNLTSRGKRPGYTSWRPVHKYTHVHSLSISPDGLTHLHMADRQLDLPVDEVIVSVMPDIGY